MDTTHAALFLWSLVNAVIVLVLCWQVFRPARRG